MRNSITIGAWAAWLCLGPSIGASLGQSGQGDAPAMATERAEAKASTATRSPALKAILDEHYEWSMRENPESASTRGDLRFNDQLTDVSPAGTARRLAAMRDRLERLKALPTGDFTETDAVDADLLRYDLEMAIEASAIHEEQMPINALEGPHITLPQIADMVPMRTEQHHAAFASRLEKMGGYVDATVEQMRLGLKAGRVPPRVILSNTVAQIRQHCTPEVKKDPTRSEFYRPFIARGKDDELSARAKRAISASIVPALGRLADFLEMEYIPACRETLAISQGVDGPKAYDLALRRHTTLALTAAQIHEMGLKEVARIRAEMLRVIRETDWDGKDKYASDDERLAKFLEFLRTSPRFYYADAKDMLRDYRDIGKKADESLPRLFGTLPRNSWGVREIPRFAAPSSPAAYYYPGSIRSGVPGYFMVNTYQMDQRPKYGMVSLTLHEAVPGHHLQTALATEVADTRPDMHPYRTLIGHTAYVEGWALYAERLGLEMGENPAPGGRGLYADPYDYFGRLSDEMWRAARLVVDTGLHGDFALPGKEPGGPGASGWSRKFALDYMMENTAGTEVDLRSEIDRYIGWPGQACAYKIGELTIIALREKATRELGEKFDLREFHDAVLGEGALPMPVLKARIERWIATKK